MIVRAGCGCLAAFLLAAPAYAAEPAVETLRHAALHRDVATVAAMLEQGENFRAASAWSGAVIGGSDEVVRLFLKRGADPNAALDEKKTPPLLLAANRGYTDICQTLIDAGAQVNGVDKWGATALAAAAVNGRTETLKLLLACGADPTLSDSSGTNPLEFAMRKHFIQAADILRTAMTGKPRQERVREFLDAVRRQNDQVVTDFLAESATSYPEVTEGMLLAAARGNASALRQCLDWGAPAKTHGPARFTPLLYAAIRGDTAMAEALIEAGAEVNYGNATGLTPLMAAAKANHAALLTKLIAAGASLDQTDGQGRSALGFAIARSCEDAARVLREAGATSISTPIVPPSPGGVRVPSERAIARTVTLAPFTSADNTWPSLEAAGQFSALLQLCPEVGKVRWVERAELEKAERELNLQPGIADASASVRLGKWLRSDLLVTGRFGLDEGEGRTLEIEVIDLRRADVLARRSMPVASRLGEPLESAAADVATAGRLVHSALAEAEDGLVATEGDLVLAPFDFHNVTRSTARLNFLGDKLRDAFGDVSQEGLRVVRFPRVEEAIGEAELSVSGLVEDDPEAWRKVADVYVWGSYEELDPEGKAFEEVEIRVDLEIWNGAEPPEKMTETFPVGAMDDALPRLARRVAERVAAGAPKEAGESAGVEASRRLFARARELQAEERDLGESMRRTTAWLQSWHRRLGLLDIARFLAPGDSAIDREWMVERWNQEAFFARPYRDDWMPHQFWGMWRQCEAWGRHVDRFGFEALRDGKRDPVLESKLPPVGSTRNLAERPLQDIYLYLPCQAVSYVSYGVSGYPDPVPAALNAEWQQRFTREFVRRLRIVADQCPGQFSIRYVFLNGELERIQNPVLQAEAYAALWQLSGTEKMVLENHTKFRQGMDRAFTRAGRLAELEPLRTMYAGPQVGDPGYRLGQSSHEERTKKLAEYEQSLLARSDLLPGELPATFQEIKLADEKFNAVTQLHAHAGKIWLAAKPLQPNETRLWCYDPATGSSEPSADVFLAGIQEFTALLSHESGLWLGTDGSGIWRYDPAAKSLHKFGSENGLATLNIGAAALGRGKLFIGGGTDSAALGALDLATGKWTMTESPSASGKSESGIPVAMATSGRWLASINISPGSREQHLWIYDTAVAQWHQSADVTFEKANAGFRSQFKKPVLAGDETGFWTGLGRKLTRVAAGSTPVSLDLSEALGGDITAIADDGEFLWLAGSREERQGLLDYHCHVRVVLVRKSTLTVTGFVTVPYNAPVVSMVADGGKLWLGLDTRFETRASFLQLETASLKSGKQGNE